MYIGTGEFQYVAAYTVQVLEFFETFDEELKSIWRAPWTWVKCVFLFVRYGSLATQGMILHQQIQSTLHPYTHAQCFRWAILRTFAPFVYAGCVNIILIARVYALYNRSKRLLFVLLLLYISKNIVGFTLFSRVFLHPIEYNSRCEVQHVIEQNTYLWTAILPLCLDLIILVLTVKRVLLLNRRPRPIPMLRTIIVDGTWAAFLVWSAVAGSVALAVSGYIQASYIIANSWMITMMSFAATRTVLNVRRYNVPKPIRANEANTETEVYNLTLTAHIPVEATLMLGSRNE